MKKFITTAIKVIIAAALMISGLIALTIWRLKGIHFFGIYITPEQVNMLVDSAGTYVYIVYVAIVLLVVCGYWIGRKFIKRN